MSHGEPPDREPGARTRAAQDGTLLRLAAGGFRDMTRVAAGHPGIWPDICAENAAAIVAALLPGTWKLIGKRSADHREQRIEWRLGLGSAERHWRASAD